MANRGRKKRLDPRTGLTEDGRRPAWREFTTAVLRKHGVTHTPTEPEPQNGWPALREICDWLEKQMQDLFFDPTLVSHALKDMHVHRLWNSRSRQTVWCITLLPGPIERPTHEELLEAAELRRLRRIETHGSAPMSPELADKMDV